MEELAIMGTPKTPAVRSDSNQGLLEITGRSNPENTVEVFKPIVNWVEEYIQNPGEKTTINIQLEHFNTSSSKSLIGILKRLEALKKEGRDIVINWYYDADDEDILEAGENFESVVEIPFNLIPA
ncbi:MAG: nuclear pore complex subunit [Bacteroides sp. SM1_62]|nr:MAG: nuclear pore complex subunit [Bacteroides sp. SM1_62]